VALLGEPSRASPRVFPANTEARTFFQVLSQPVQAPEVGNREPQSQPYQQVLSDEEMERLRKDNQRMFDEEKKQRQQLQNKAPNQ